RRWRRAPVAELDALERELFALGAEVGWPPTPRLASAVRVRLWPRRVWSRRLVLALVAATVAVALAAGAVAAGWVHIPGVNIQRTTRLPATSTPKADPLGLRLDLGDLQPALAAAQAAAVVPVAVPAALGSPDQVFFRASPVPAVALVYRPRADLPAGKDPEVGALFMEFRTSGNDVQFVQKMVGPGTRIETVTVGGSPGLWLEGQPHAVFLQPSPGGDLVVDNIRLAGNTLLWYRSGVTYRLEAGVTKERALEIAGTAG
ncbi:MAG: hypothetical protein ABI838_05500, partial [Chloroflexota bacterium]